jgi:hypothetical protein
MIFQEGVELMDSVLLIFLILATCVFALSTYRKAELRMFSITLTLMAVGVIWCIIGSEIMEAIFVIMASSVAGVTAIFLRIKTKKLEV